MKLRLAAVIFLLAGTIACAVVDITKTTKAAYDPTNPKEVEILRTIPDRHFVELGTVTAAGFDLDETAKMYRIIRSKAAELGADAVLLDEGIDEGAKWATGVAVRYK